MKTLITGASGFLGSKLTNHLVNLNYSVVTATRNIDPKLPSNIPVGNIDFNTDWTKALKDVDIVVHCAARAHKTDNDSFEAEKEFFSINFDGTKKLLEDCVTNDVKKFIFISSIKVIGNHQFQHNCVNESVKPAPTDFYGKSKYLAECLVEEICGKASIDFIILRPCLIYGEGVKANLKVLNSAISRLPIFPTFTSTNHRSLTNINDLIDVILKSVTHDIPSGRYFVADSIPYSTKEICERINLSYGNKCILFDTFNIILEKIFSIPLFINYREKLFGSACVDCSLAKSVFKIEFEKNFS